MTYVRRLAASFLTILWGFSLSACVHMDGPYRGKVVELETGKPIEGAVVAAEWTIKVFAHYERRCDLKETVTDKNGEFELPKGWCVSQPFAEVYKPQVVIFKPGYLGYPPLGYNQEQRRVYMPHFSGKEFRDKKQFNSLELGRPNAREERELTLGHAESLFSDNKAFKKLPILHNLVNEEARILGLGGIGPFENGGRK